MNPLSPLLNLLAKLNRSDSEPKTQTLIRRAIVRDKVERSGGEAPRLMVTLWRALLGDRSHWDDD